VFLAMCPFFACTLRDGSGKKEPENAITVDWAALNKKGGAKIEIDWSTTYQTMKGFGASDCWSGNFVGQWNDEAKKEQIADWLFSQELDSSGNPQGIGLSLWRVNLGAGSWEQSRGDDGRVPVNPRIGTNVGGSDIWPTDYTRMTAAWERRAESFLESIYNPKGADGKIRYNWDKQKGQQYWMAEAKKRGLESFVLFSNAPPVPFTRFGFANAGNQTAIMGSNGRYIADRNTILQDNDAAYTDFADYLADVAEHFSRQGYKISHISPFNEPQWEWNENKQEGSPWTNAQMGRMIRALDTAIQARPAIAGPNGVKQLITEAAQWNFLTDYSETNVRDQIFTFFSPQGANYVGNLISMQPWEVAAHSYFTHATDSGASSVRKMVALRAAEIGNNPVNNNKPIIVRSSEWCALGGGGGFSNLNDYFDVGLYMAKLAYIDITVANAVSFDFWTALDMERGGNSRYSLIGYAPGSETYNLESFRTNPITSPGALKTQPTLWALGSYSLFVRPGFQRIKITSENFLPNPKSGEEYMEVMASAYKSPPGYKDKDGKELNRVVVVYVNMSDTLSRSLAVEFPRNQLPINLCCFETTRNNTSDGTSNRLGMRRVAQKDGIYTIKPRSIVTVVYDFPVP